MANNFTEKILTHLARKNYEPLKPKALARKIGASGDHYPAFRSALRELIRMGRLEIGKGNAVRPAGPHGTARA